MIFVDDVSDGHVIVLANSSFLRMTGLEYSQVLGRNISEAFAGITDDQNVKYISERLARDQPGTWEMSCNRSDGTTFITSIFIHPRRDLTEHRQHILSFYILTDQKDRSNNSDRETRLLFRHAPSFIATSKGPEHRITFVNESYKKYVGQDRLEGRTVADAIPEADSQGFIEILDRVFQTGVPFRGEAVPFKILDTKSGKAIRRYANFIYEPVHDADLKIIGIFCEGYDVTEQIEAKAALKTLQTQLLHTSRVNAMGTMATTMAHELNQPLTIIANYVTGCLRLIDSGSVNSDVLKPALVSIESAAHRAGSIIRTLRDLTDRRVRSVAIFELKPVVNEALNLVRTACSLDTQIETFVPSEIALEADRTQIQQVIINLVRNGCDAVSDRTTQKITISANATSDEVVVSVKDSGPGLTAASAQGLFTWSDSIKEDGMGLGLSISRTIVESHGGRIWLEESSEAGTEFRFSVPIARRGDVEPDQKSI